MEKENRTPGYMAYIPSDVRYDKELKPNEKLLFGEISALATAKGHCWATNKYFADLYDVAVETVSRWISHLAVKGYIKTKIVYHEDGKTIKERRITVNFFRNFEDEEEDGMPIDEKIKGIDEKINQPIDEKINQPIDEKIKENNTSINNTSKNNIKENIKRKNEVFKKPTLEEITAYIQERKSPIDPEAFYAYYESVGWIVGKKHMKNWKMAIITWEKKREALRKENSKTERTYGSDKPEGFDFFDF